MTYVAVLLVCLAGQPCDALSHEESLTLPGTYATPYTCQAAGMLAMARYGRLLAEGYVPRVLCRRVAGDGGMG